MCFLIGGQNLGIGQRLPAIGNVIGLEGLFLELFHGCDSNVLVPVEGGREKKNNIGVKDVSVCVCYRCVGGHTRLDVAAAAVVAAAGAAEEAAPEAAVADGSSSGEGPASDAETTTKSLSTSTSAVAIPVTRKTRTRKISKKKEKKASFQNQPCR